MEKIIIVGAGIAGLSAGAFGAINNFDVELYEMHYKAGGECTGWDRSGYHFDNCIHWLTGTKKGTELYKIWETVGALGNTEIYDFEYLYSFSIKEKKLYLYRDLERLKEQFLEFAPEDKNEILKLIEAIEKIQSTEIPTKASCSMSLVDSLKLIKSYSGLGKLFKEFNAISIEDYSKRFESNIIRKFILNSMPSNYSAISLIFMLGTFTSGNGAYPKGGSLAMSMRMANKLESLGGKINYKAKVKEIIIENGIAKGIQLKTGKKVYGDYIVAATDANVLMEKLLKGKYKDKVFDTEFNNPNVYKVHSSVDIGIGISCDLSSREHCASFEVKPFKCGTETVSRISLKHYCYEESFAPKGNSVVKISIVGDDYNYWSSLKAVDKERYYEEKTRVGQDVILRVEDIYPEIKGKIEVYDIATPATYERYCGAYRGAWMGFDKTVDAKSFKHNGIIKGVKNLYVGGQWIMMPGGLPTACLSGKWAIEKICKDNKKKFKEEK